MSSEKRAESCGWHVYPLMRCRARAYPEFMNAAPTQRRSLKYIRLAAHFAALPSDVSKVSMTIGEIEDLLSLHLPDDSKTPSWWRNDDRRMHSRAWLAAGWEVTSVDIESGEIVFERTEQHGDRPTAT